MDEDMACLALLEVVPPEAIGLAANVTLALEFRRRLLLLWHYWWSFVIVANRQK